MAATGYTTGDPNKVSRSGDTMTGELVLPDSSPDAALSAASRGYVDNEVNALSGTYVDTSGDTMTGDLRIQYGLVNTLLGHDMSVVASTGIMYQEGPLSLATSTSVTVPAGIATFVGPHHVHDDPRIGSVAYGPETVTITDLTDPLTYLLVDSTGAIIQNAGVPTRAQRREFAVLGRVVVLSNVIVSVQDSPILASQPLATTLDILNAMGDIRLSGVRLTPVGGNLEFNVSEGQIFNLGANNSVDPDDPNVSTFTAQTPGSFRYVSQNSIISATPRTTIDPTIYDVGGVSTAVPGGAGTSTIQRVHCFPTQNTFIQLGQNTFSSLQAALDSLTLGESGAMPFVTHPDLVGGGVRTGFIVVTRTATDLADTVNARVLRATRLGDPGGL
jgi:hypothetical protein